MQLELPRGSRALVPSGSPVGSLSSSCRPTIRAATSLRGGQAYPGCQGVFINSKRSMLAGDAINAALVLNVVCYVSVVGSQHYGLLDVLSPVCQPMLPVTFPGTRARAFLDFFF